MNSNQWEQHEEGHCKAYCIVEELMIPERNCALPKTFFIYQEHTVHHI